MDTREAIVIVLVKKDDIIAGFGTGFVIAISDTHSYILTAAHVVDESDNNTIYVRVRDSVTPATLIAKGDRDSSDYALLQIEGKLKAQVYTLASTASVKQQIEIVGCHLYDENSFMIKTLYGYLGNENALGSMTGGDFVKTWNIEIDRNKNRNKLEEGYSGSPVIDINTGNVIAMVSRKHSEGDSGLSIALDGLLALWSRSLEKEIFSLLRIEQFTIAPVYEIASNYINEVNFNHEDQLQEFLTRVLETIQLKHKTTQFTNANMFPVITSRLLAGLIRFQIGNLNKPCMLLPRRGNRGKRPPFYRSGVSCWLEALVDIKEELLSIDLLTGDNIVEKSQHLMKLSDLEKMWLLHFDENHKTPMKSG